MVVSMIKSAFGLVWRSSSLGVDNACQTDRDELLSTKLHEVFETVRDKNKVVVLHC